jgi:hypothetical protein
MDDPWDSPWADETQFEKQDDGKKEVAEVPVRTTHPNFGVTTNSPWGDGGDDEDEFGEWSSVPTTTDTKLGTEDLETTWARTDAQAGVAIGGKEDQEFGWDLARSGDLRELELPKAPGNNTAQSSPDPWKASNTSTIATETYFDSNHAAIEADTEESHGLDHLRISSPRSQTSLHAIAHGTGQQQPVGITDDWDHAPTITEVTLSNEQDVSSKSPRSSTSQSIHSQVEELEHHETPRTSLDDEHNRPPMPRKASSKIQPLIAHFDGLSKDEEVSQIQANATKTGASSGAEESKQNVVGSSAMEEKLVGVSLERGSHVELGSREPIHQPSTTESDDKPTVGSKNGVALDLDLTINFEVDTSILDQLFSGTSIDTDTEDVFIPDVVPYESFTTMEQRKTWYRISRYGSMRKHDSGNDDSYTRLSWMSSRVHDETIKIVARWMEEDRLSGQVMLGGTGRTSALFGWGDAKSPAVSLDAVFAARQSKRQSVLADKLPSSVSANATTASNSAIANITKPLMTSDDSPITSFGWSNNGPARTSLEHVFPPPQMAPNSTSPILPPISHAPLQVAGMQKAQRVKESITTTPTNSELHKTSAGTSSTPIANIVIAQEEAEDEDDWGEMVSTPVDATRPNLFSGESADEPQTGSSAEAALPATRYSPASAVSIDQDIGHFNGPTAEDTSARATVHENMAQASEQGPVAAKSWESADFSFFDTSPPQPALSTPDTSTPSSPIKLRPVRPSPLKQVTFSNAMSVRPPSDIAAPESTQIKESLSVDEEMTVRNIVRGLPDLSYMLKK